MTTVVELDSLEMIATGIDHAEGICVTTDDTVYVSGEAGQIYRLEPDGSATQVATTGGWTLGLAADGEGRIYACDPVHHAVMRWTPGDGDPMTWTDGGLAGPLACPNWGAFAADGSFYLTDSGGWKARDGRVLVVRPGSGPASARTSVWTRESLDFPNGLAVSPDGQELWVLESTPGAMVAYAIRPDGSAGPRRVVADLTGTVPDGLAFTTDGSVIIACYRPDIVYRWRSDLGLEILVHDPEGTAIAAPTNVVFAGPSRDHILVPNIGRWHVTRFRVPGLSGVPLCYPTAAELGD
jgi:gluconolactonase